MAHLRAVQQHPNTRIKELEDEVRRLTMENAQMKTELDKATRRWERLKEGARQRRRRTDGGTEEGSIPEEKEKD